MYYTYIYLLYVHIICTYYMYYMSILYVHITCTYYMYILYKIIIQIVIYSTLTCTLTLNNAQRTFKDILKM